MAGTGEARVAVDLNFANPANAARLRQLPQSTGAAFGAQRPIDCLEAIMRERNSNSRTARRAAAGGGRLKGDP
jgi:hypothetical protein